MHTILLGILTLQPTSLAQPKAKAKAFSRHHFIMFSLGFPSIVFGTFAIWYAHSHGSAHGHHAKSWHGVNSFLSSAFIDPSN
jgi:cytochrome b-561 domain containing protein 2